MKTKVTELFGISYPIVLSGMSWISIPEMVAAVSNAGGLGILATGPLSADETRCAVREIRRLTEKPFGANATLLFPGAKDNARVLLEEEVPVINYSLGKGDWIAEAAHRYGGKVVATVVNGRHGKKAQQQGSDALIVTGHEAAAHGGDVTSLVLVPSIVDLVDIPVIAAGGFADGRGLAAALALGAEGIAMGTRFMSTQESPLHTRYKETSLERDVTETIYGTYFDGMGCRSLKTAASVRAYRKGFLGLPNFFKAAGNAADIARMLNLPSLKLFVGVMASGWKNSVMMAYLANAFKAIQRASENGDMDRGVLPAGQSMGLLHDVPSVSELLERMVSEAEAVHGKISRVFQI